MKEKPGFPPDIGLTDKAVKLVASRKNAKLAEEYRARQKDIDNLDDLPATKAYAFMLEIVDMCYAATVRGDTKAFKMRTRIHKEWNIKFKRKFREALRVHIDPIAKNELGAKENFFAWWETYNRALPEPDKTVPFERVQELMDEIPF